MKGRAAGPQAHTASELTFVANVLQLLRHCRPAPIGPSPPANVQDQDGRPQPSLGTHRLWAAEAVALLLLPTHASIDTAVADAGLLPRLVELALSLDKSNVLHCRVLRMLQCSLRSSVDRLWSVLLEPGCRVPGAEDSALQPLQAQLIMAGECTGGRHAACLSPSGSAKQLVAAVVLPRSVHPLAARACMEHVHFA